jgi:hypothetical protein
MNDLTASRLTRVAPKNGGPKPSISSIPKIIFWVLVAAAPCASAETPSAPSGLTATPGNAWVTLNWTAPSGTISYYVVQGWTAGSTTNILFDTSYTSYTDFAAEVGTDYNYSVIAVNTNGPSPAAGEVTSTPTGAAFSYVHPGGLHVMADFNRMATNVAAKNYPWNWPRDHTGWTLQMQTDALNTGLGANWVDVTNSSLTNQFLVPFDATQGSSFFQLKYP